MELVRPTNETAGMPEEIERYGKYWIRYGRKFYHATVTHIYRYPDGIVEIHYRLGWLAFPFRDKDHLSAFVARMQDAIPKIDDREELERQAIS